MAYPYKKHNYAVLIDGFKRAHFSEVSAAEVEAQPIEYREGDVKEMSPGKPSGLARYGNVTLKWGTSENLEFVDWIKKCAGGETERKKVLIQLVDGENSDVKAQWELEEACPVEYTAPDSMSTDSEVTFERIELCHEGLTRTK